MSKLAEKTIFWFKTQKINPLTKGKTQEEP